MIYEYFCDACQSVFEIRRAIADRDTPQHCGICGAQMKRKYQTPAIIWQGRVTLAADGVDDRFVFPKMQSVRREDKLHRGIDFNEQARLAT